MSFSGNDIRTLRQRLGWSQTEMARRLGCDTSLLRKLESDKTSLDSQMLNRLRSMRHHVEASSEKIQQKPFAEKQMEERRMAQLTHRDLMKDIQ